MGAVWYRFRAEFRTRWRAWLGLALLVGLAAGTVMLLVAGARRTESAYSRFLREERAAVVAECAAAGDAQPLHVLPTSNCSVADLGRLPGVHAVAPVVVFGPGRVVVRTARGRLVSIDPHDANHSGEGEILVSAGEDGRFGTAVQKAKILEGRPAAAASAREATVNFALAERIGLDVGDRLRMRFAVFDGTGIPPEDVASAARTRTEIVRIVGIEVSPSEVPPPSGQWEAGIHLTPAFARRAIEHDLFGQHGVAVLLGARTTARDLEQTLTRSRLRFGVFDTTFLSENVERGIRPQVVALVIVAALAGLAALVLLGAALVRLAFVEAADAPTLSGLGMGRRELWGLSVLRATLIGAVAAVIAVIVAAAASPLMPTGQARILEPDRGLDVDVAVFAIGALASLALVVLVTAVAMLRAARVGRPGERAVGARARPSLVDAAVARLPLNVAATTGTRMALDPGRGVNAVPVRSTIAAVAVGLSVLVGALVFSASLGHLLDTPRLVGWNWDVAVQYPYERGPDGRPVPIVPESAIEAAFTGNRDVRGVAPGILFRPFAVEPALELGPGHVGAEVLTFGSGSVGPTVISGRAPASAGEILLGPHTLDELGAEIGDPLAVATQVADPVTGGTRRVSVRMRIVGTGVVPLSGGHARLGKGATLTLEGVKALNPDAVPDVLWVRLAPRADAVQVINAVGRSLGIRGHVRRADLIGYQQTNELSRVQTVDDFPLVLAALMSVMAAGVCAHVLVVGTRRRRRDLAILATLGFGRRQVRSTVSWQALAVAIVALVVAVPVGVAAGRLSWRLYADGMGVLSEPAVPWLVLAGVVGACLAVAKLIAVFPARAAVRLRPGEMLRAE